MAGNEIDAQAQTTAKPMGVVRGGGKGESRFTSYIAAKAHLAGLGVRLRRTAFQEYGVRLIAATGNDGWYYTGDLDDAVATGRLLAGIEPENC